MVREDRDIEGDGEVLVHSLPFRMTAVLLFGEDSCEELPLFVGLAVRKGGTFFLPLTGIFAAVGATVLVLGRRMGCSL